MTVTKHPPAKVLIIDDERDIRELLVLTLQRMNLHVDTAANLREARAQLAQNSYRLCFTDMHLPDGSGLDFVNEVNTQYPQMPIAVITAFGNVDSAVEALKSGAFDFVSKPLDLQTLRNLVTHALGSRNTKPSAVRSVTSPFHGTSESVTTLRTTITKVARSQAPVVIIGESGVGKELAARSIHAQSNRSGCAFIPVNCAAIPAELMESEFFGHKKGSFTGAHSDNPGLFQAAHGGTLLLDEVAELPLSMQVKLLRAIQEKSIRPVGVASEVPIDIRLISATHKDLDALVRNGQFRHDLYYRIHVITLHVPSLRERVEDIPKLIEQTLDRLCQNQPRSTLTNDALHALQAYPFPGNVRELENILERAIAMAENQRIHVIDLQLPSASIALHNDDSTVDDDNTASTTTTLPDYVDALERHAIQQALSKHKHNKTKAAQALGISFRALRYRLKKLGIN